MPSTLTYNPSYLIKINGVELRHGANVDILSLSVTDTSDRADAFHFSVQDRHSERGRFAAGATLKWMDSGLFDEGNEVEIHIGYVNNMQFMLRGDITASAPSFPDSGAPVLEVRGFNFYQRLQRKRRSKPFKASTDAAIVREIASEMNFTAEVDDPGFEYKIVPPNNASYADIIRQRAQRIGYEFVVKDRTLYFQVPRYRAQPQPTLSLEWGRDLKNFRPQLTTYGLATEVSVRVSQTARGRGKDPIVGKATAGEERVKMGAQSGSEIVQALYGDNALRADDQHVASQAEANELALAQLEVKSLEFISGSGACIGNPALLARSVIELKGLGKRFSGHYYVTSATHTIDGNGYQTSFEVKRNAR